MPASLLDYINEDKALVPDLAGRKLLVAAFLYYVMDSPTMSDHEYDMMSIYVADNWDQLSDVRKWACGDADSTRASGAHFKFSVYNVDAALYQLHSRFMTPGEYHAFNWKEENGLRYITTAGFAVDDNL